MFHPDAGSARSDSDARTDHRRPAMSDHGGQSDLRQTMDLIAAGRTSNLTCPFCKKDKLKKGMGDYESIVSLSLQASLFCY